MKGIQQAFKKACERGKIIYGRDTEGGLRFHDLRATFDTNMEVSGVSDAMRKALMGHSQAGMDKHYIRFDESHLQAAMDRYTVWFDTEFLQNGHHIGHHLEIYS